MKKIGVTILALFLLFSAFSGIDFAEGKTLEELYAEEEILIEQKMGKKEKVTIRYENAHKYVHNDTFLQVNELTKSFIEENPEVSEVEINKFVVKVSKELYKNVKGNEKKEDSNPGIQWYSNYSPVALNDHEKALYDENPWKGNQALVWGKEAWDYTTYKFGGNGHNDRSDAFRHAYWNIVMVAGIDHEWARRWATAHETGAIIQLQYEYTMDMNNNYYGRYYAAINGLSGSSSINDCRAVALSVYTSGTLQVILNETPTHFTGSTSDFIN